MQIRICSYCSKKLTKGYVIHKNKEREVFCNEYCMEQGGYSYDKYEAINDANEGDSYYYDWSND